MGGGPTDDLRDRLQDALDPRFELGSLIGSGGFAHVFEARDHRLDRAVAIKVLRPEVARDETVVRRFFREARTVARLEHPNIVPIHTIEDEDGLVFFVMQRIRGETLRDVVERGPTDPEQVRDILLQCAEGLEAAHEAGVIHRDLKPENVMLVDGRVVLMDFGIARAPGEGDPGLTSSREIVGTPRYMSPEQATGDSLDRRSDLYSLGCVGYELLSGRPPFGGSTSGALIAQHVSQAPEDLGTGDVERAIMKCLEKAPGDRWADAASLAARLRAPLSRRMARPDASPTYNAVTVHWPKIALGLVALSFAAWFVAGAGTISVQSYAVAWAITTWGLWFAFDRAEASISGHVRRQVAHWIRATDLRTGYESIPRQFAGLFDRIFGDSLRTFDAFARSCVASGLGYVAVFCVTASGTAADWAALGGFAVFGGAYAAAYLIGERLSETRPSKARAVAFVLLVPLCLFLLVFGTEVVETLAGVTLRESAFGVLAASVLLVNFVPDYASLVETRWAIQLMEEHPRRLLPIVLFDLVMTASISFVAVFLLIWITPVFGSWDGLHLFDPERIVAASEWALSVPFGPAVPGLDLAPVGSPMTYVRVSFYTAFFTSAWLYLYIVAWLLSRVLVRMSDGVGFLLRVTDVQRQPFRSMGFVTLIVTTALFLLGLPLVLR